MCSPTYEALQRQCLNRPEVDVRQLELGFQRWADYTRNDELVSTMRVVFSDTCATTEYWISQELWRIMVFGSV